MDSTRYVRVSRVLVVDPKKFAGQSVFEPRALVEGGDENLSVCYVKRLANDFTLFSNQCLLEDCFYPSCRPNDPCSGSSATSGN